MIEVLCAVAIIAILAGLVLGLGKRIKIQAEERLCVSGIDIIEAAIDQYYDQYDEFPFVSELKLDLTPAYDQVELQVLLDFEFGGALASSIPVLPAGEYDYASSEALYYYLDKKCPNSRKLIDKLDDSLISSKDTLGVDRKYSIGGADVLELVRFIDPWGNSLRYLYSVGDVYPVVESPGADGVFGTSDDIKGG